MEVNVSKKSAHSDEANFHLDNFVDPQNCRNCGSENPREIGDTQTDPQRITVWCGFRARDIIRQFDYCMSHFYLDHAI